MGAPQSFPHSLAARVPAGETMSAEARSAKVDETRAEPVIRPRFDPLARSQDEAD